MLKNFILFVSVSIMMSFLIPTHAQHDSIKPVADTVYVHDSLLLPNSSITLPIKQPKLKALLSRMPFVELSDDGDVEVFGSPVISINNNGKDGIVFTDFHFYSIAILPFSTVEELVSTEPIGSVKIDNTVSLPSPETIGLRFGHIIVALPLVEGGIVESYLLKHNMQKKGDDYYIKPFLEEKEKMSSLDVGFWVLYWAIKDSLL